MNINGQYTKNTLGSNTDDTTIKSTHSSTEDPIIIVGNKEDT